MRINGLRAQKLDELRKEAYVPAVASDDYPGDL